MAQKLGFKRFLLSRWAQNRSLILPDGSDLKLELVSPCNAALPQDRNNNITWYKLLYYFDFINITKKMSVGLDIWDKLFLQIISSVDQYVSIVRERSLLELVAVKLPTNSKYEILIFKNES